MLPTHGYPGFDGDPGLDRGWQHRILVLLRLLFEQFPTGHADHSGADSLLGQFVIGFYGKLNLRAGTDYDDIGVDSVRVQQYVSAFGQFSRVTRDRAVVNWQSLAGEQQGHRPVPSLQGDLPGLSGLVGIGRPNDE